jgi:hypothetical protein
MRCAGPGSAKQAGAQLAHNPARWRAKIALFNRMC